MNQRKVNDYIKQSKKIIQGEELLQQERLRDEKSLNAGKQKLINELKQLRKEDLFEVPKTKKLTLAQRLKKIFGR